MANKLRIAAGPAGLFRCSIVLFVMVLVTATIYLSKESKTVPGNSLWTPIIHVISFSKTSNISENSFKPDYRNNGISLTPMNVHENPLKPEYRNNGISLTPTNARENPLKLDDQNRGISLTPIGSALSMPKNSGNSLKSKSTSKNNSLKPNSTSRNNSLKPKSTGRNNSGNSLKPKRTGRKNSGNSLTPMNVHRNPLKPDDRNGGISLTPLGSALSMPKNSGNSLKSKSTGRNNSGNLLKPKSTGRNNSGNSLNPKRTGRTNFGNSLTLMNVHRNPLKPDDRNGGISLTAIGSALSMPKNSENSLKPKSTGKNNSKNSLKLKSTGRNNSQNSLKPKSTRRKNSRNSLKPKKADKKNSRNSLKPKSTRGNNSENLLLPKSTGRNNSLKQCDFSSGKWVYDNNSYPLYKDHQCPHMFEDLACEKFGRKDLKYQNWRWQPNNCEIPRFNAKALLERLKDKRLVFVGDSLNRNQWVSMMCLLESTIPKELRSMKLNGSLYTFKATEYNASIDFYWAPLLVESNADDPANHRLDNLIVKIDAIEKHARHWIDADILVFNSYQWWISIPEFKVSSGSFETPKKVNNVVKSRYWYKMVLKTWSNWLDIHVNRTKTKLFFVSMTATHLQAKEWGKTIYHNCMNEREPIMKEGYRGSRSDPKMMEILEEVIRRMKTKGVEIQFINVAQLTEYRKDGHPSIYRKQWWPLSKEQLSNPMSYADCTHWCLPGVPDVWNEILSAFIMNL